MKPSKSKLAMAKVINENGGWPQDSEWAVQNGDHGRISFSINKPVRHDSKSWMAKGGFNFKIEVCKPLKNWHQNVLSREEYYQAYPKADADGWIEWKWGECPVDIAAVVDVRQLDGHEYTARAVNFHWLLKSGSVSVAAYRLHKPEVKPEFCKSVMRSIPEPESHEKLSPEAIEDAKFALMSESIEESKRKPTIEQLAQDYRNKLDFANSKQQEADEAKAAADAALSELERAGEEIGLLLSPIREGKKPEINIIDWRDLMVGDEIICSEDGNWNCDMAGNVCVVREIESQEYTGCMPILAEYCGASDWGDKFTFVRRP